MTVDESVARVLQLAGAEFPGESSAETVHELAGVLTVYAAPEAIRLAFEDVALDGAQLEEDWPGFDAIRAFRVLGEVVDRLQVLDDI